MGHVRHAEPRKALDGAVSHVDRVIAQCAVDERLRRALPAFDLVLAQAGDEVALLGGGEVGILRPSSVWLARSIPPKAAR
jgi:hypothetical protein